MKYTLVTIRPQGFIHSNGFRELQESTGWALAALGHESNITENAFSGDGENIIFGAELLSIDSQLPPNATIFNIEQDSHPSFSNVLKLGKNAANVWEYSAANLPHWKASGVNAIHVPFGYTKNLTRIPTDEKKIWDVFFSGWLSPRRKEIIDKLRVDGLRVAAVDSCYAGSRDQMIAASEICLNLNHDGRTLTNIQRLSFWMANSKCILSEFSSDKENYPWLERPIVNCSYDKIAYFVHNLLDNDDWRWDMGEAAFKAIKEQDFVTTIASAIEAQPKKNPILERYERGCREGDMREYLPWLRANAKGNCLEIGVRDGASTSALLLGIEENGGRLYSCDINDASGLWSHPAWHFFQSDSKTMPAVQENYFDFCLIDGDHSREGIISDLNNCYKWAKNGAMIAVHDTHPPKTFEEFAGDWPSIAVGQEFGRFCKEKGLTNFSLVGAQGMGVLVVKK